MAETFREKAGNLKDKAIAKGKKELYPFKKDAEGKIGTRFLFEALSNNLFIALAIIGGIQIYTMSNFGGSTNIAGGFQVMQIILGTIWVLSTFAGYSGGRVGRPYIGILMIGAAIYGATAPKRD